MLHGPFHRGCAPGEVRKGPDQENVHNSGYKPKTAPVLDKTNLSCVIYASDLCMRLHYAVFGRIRDLGEEMPS
jgi:hypothetical protein